MLRAEAKLFISSMPAVIIDSQLLNMARHWFTWQGTQDILAS